MTSATSIDVRSDKKTKKSKGHQCDEDDNDDTIEPVEVQEETATAAAAEEEGDDAAASSGRKRKRKRIRKLTKKGKEGENDDKDEDDEDGGRDDDASLPLRASSSISPTAAAPGTVYVEGISYQATEDDLIRFFQDKGCGKVKEVRMPRWQDSGRPRGYAHIEFKKGGEESVGKALALNGVSMMGRYLTVQMAQAPKGGGAAAVTPGKKPPGCDTVFVKNLPYNITEDTIRDAFTFCGKIRTIRLAIWQHTQQQKGFCYIQFEKENAAEIAVKKQGVIQVGGRKVFVDYETGAPKASYKAPNGRQWSKVQGKGETARGGGGHRPPK